MIYLLSSLPESYSVLMAVLETCNQLTLQDVLRAVVSEERSRRQQASKLSQTAKW